MKPCGHPGEVDGCRVCWLTRHDPAYRRLYLSPADAREACRHLGQATGETAPCSTCAGHAEAKLFRCDVFGECTLAKKVPGVACCGGCERFEAKGADHFADLRKMVPAVRSKLSWAVGVTTIPARCEDLLPQTLASLAVAGFDRPRLFVDGGQQTDDWLRFGLEATFHEPPLRVHGNWVLALHELFIRQPKAERFAIFQDDLLACRNLRAYLEAAPCPVMGYLNLYAAPSEQRQASDASGFYPSHQNGRGALALVFDREATLTLLSARHLIERPLEPVRGWRAVDGGILEAMKKAGYREFVHHPSLVRHTGVISSFDKRKRSKGDVANFPLYQWPEVYNQTTFPGEQFDAMSLLSGAAR